MRKGWWEGYYILFMYVFDVSYVVFVYIVRVCVVVCIMKTILIVLTEFG